MSAYNPASACNLYQAGFPTECSTITQYGLIAFQLKIFLILLLLNLLKRIRTFFFQTVPISFLSGPFHLNYKRTPVPLLFYNDVCPAGPGF